MIKKKLFAIVAISCLSLPAFVPMNVSAQSDRMEELEREQKELYDKNGSLDEQIQTKEQQMENLQKERITLEKDVSELQKNIDALILDIQEQEKEIERIENDIIQLQEEIDLLELQIEQRTEQLENQARSVQTEGNTSDIIDMVVSAEDISDLIGRIGMVSKIVSANQTIMQAQIDDQEALEVAEQTIQKEREDVQTAKSQLEVDRNNLVAQRVELDDKIIQVAERFDMSEQEKASFISEQQLIAQRTSTLSTEMQEEQARIVEEQRKIQEEERLAEEQRQREEEEAFQLAETERIAAEEALAAEKQQPEVSTSESSKEETISKPVAPSNPEPSKPSNPEPSAPSVSSGWTRPANGRISSPMGTRTHPISGEQKLHRGIDIAGGGPISAAKGGKVVTASFSNSYGYHVKIDHGDGFTTLYAHMQAGLKVAPGQTVSQGQQIGIMGTTGASTGVHLHFEVTSGGNLVDPLTYIGR
ncbi:murein hydrolase activator EnvC [Marinilactibacillus sp. Marseille-P9653]|uniref:murein hydrolase activator EnvC family protein n=1 Tax=Marinilactibacillus sp. Marseille-P9653 TaxID=2866583 RepID=UPI001CE42D46|nr:peptidoglycan DD-metalloendopeptidase family protein [Marinilactibacillus sp. Marseille-P9653]